MKTTVTVLHNVTDPRNLPAGGGIAGAFFGYSADCRLTYAYKVERATVVGVSPVQVAEEIFAQDNMGILAERNDAAVRSLSVGDVVVIRTGSHYTVMACESLGWRLVSLDDVLESLDI